MSYPSELLPQPEAQHLLFVKNALNELWSELPAEHQATMILVLLKQVLQTEYQPWVIDTIKRLFIDEKGKDGMG